MFIDQAKIHVKAGSGGKGCRSMYTDMWNIKGFPDGGDGGNGADIVVRADRNLRTLLDLTYNRHFRGDHGGHGSGKKKRGRDAQDVIIRVPTGTRVTDADTGAVLGNLDEDASQLTVARGGKGGMGNRKDRPVTAGEPGEERTIILDLRLFADAGLIGFPNAGKSTLISALTAAASASAAYPFTTRYPVLGTLDDGDRGLVIADIPGLIEGSSKGRGLGDRFLRHVERTKVLIHVVDMAGFEGRDPIEDFKVINAELKEYGSGLTKKPQIVAANKMDLDGSAGNLKRFKKLIKTPSYPVSALTHEGLPELAAALKKMLRRYEKTA